MLVIKNFHDLSVSELYEILKARVDIFVVEQKCPYPELDNIDQDSDHLMIYDGDILAAYARVFRRDTDTMQIGRVIAPVRGKGYGGEILHEATKYASSHSCKKIYLEAQTYAIGFYEKEGFEVVSEPFDEDGIMHVQMIKSL